MYDALQAGATRDEIMEAIGVSVLRWRPGTLLFTSDTHIPVITNGSPTEDVEIVVVPVP
ncbi:MAG: hypothetical protein R3C44_24375 [Chloroflexota bacterium]